MSVASLSAGSITIFTGLRLIDGTGREPVDDASVVIEDGRIVAAGKMDPAAYSERKDKEVVACAGQTIIPGLISDHSHVGLVKDGKVSPENYTAENIEATLRQYESYGITAVMSLGVNKDLLYPLRDAQRHGQIGGAEVFTADHGLGVTNAAPPLPVGTDQIARPKTADEARQFVREMADRHADIIKLWVDDFFGSVEPKMPPEIYRAIIDEAHQHGLRVAAHLFYLEDAKQLLRDGLDVVAHSVRDQPVDDEFITLAKHHHAAYIATLALDESQYVYAEHPAWMDSAAFRAAADPKLLETWLSPQYAARMKANPTTPRNRAAHEMAMQNVKRAHDAGVLVGFGTDSGAAPTRLAGWAEHRELQLLVEAGLSPMEAIVCATRNAAQVIGAGAERGTLEPGKRADFLILAANPLEAIANTTKLVAVYHGGKRIAPAFSEK
ncbi:MAG: amidohydrolase family protein [Chthoniobacter sp.]